MNIRERAQMLKLMDLVAEMRKETKEKFEHLEEIHGDQACRLAAIDEHLKIMNGVVAKCVTDIGGVQKQMGLYETLPKIFKWSFSIVVALLGLGGAIWAVDHAKMIWKFIVGR